MTDPRRTPVVAVVGPTATGKSDLALDLAERLCGEIINADAMQFYRGMDIGTAKLTDAERRGIPHHELDVLEVTQEASVAGYQAAARADIASIRARGRVPVLVGGSGLYVRAALDHLDIPPTDPAVRAELEQQAERQGGAALYARLRAADPDAATRIQPTNVRRVVRALEVVQLTGRPFSASMPTRRFLEPTVLVGLRVERPTLYERIAARVDRMWDDGLLGEVEALLGRGLRDGVTASRAIGYRQAVDVLGGVLSRAEAVAETAAATRRYARRQESWFRPDPRITWLDATTGDAQSALVDAALTAVTSAQEQRGPCRDGRARLTRRHTGGWVS